MQFSVPTVARHARARIDCGEEGGAAARLVGTMPACTECQIRRQ